MMAIRIASAQLPLGALFGGRKVSRDTQDDVAFGRSALGQLAWSVPLRPEPHVAATQVATAVALPTM